MPVGLDTHLHLNTHRAGRGHWESTIRSWGVPSPVLEAQGRCTGGTGTHDPRGKHSQGNACSLQPQFPPLQGLWGLAGALPHCPARWGKGLVGLFTLQISLEFSN